jgi:hypothetical protein
MESFAYPFPDPRVAGVREQHARARLFLVEAYHSNDPTDRFRRLIAATYFARAVVEIMLVLLCDFDIAGSCGSG